MAYKPYIPNYSALSYSAAGNYSEFSTGYTMKASVFGAPTRPDTANQISEVTARLNEGMKAVEVGTISPEIFEQIPKQQFKEINQLAKITGSDITVHAPMIDPSGFTREGWSEWQRTEAERQLLGVIEKSAKLSDKGNVPVTIHASGVPAWEWQASLPKEEQGKVAMIAINQETGQLIPIKREERLYPEIVGKKLAEEEAAPKKGEAIPVKDELITVNRSQWSETVSNLAHFKKEGDEILDAYENQARIIMQKLRRGELEPEDIGKDPEMANIMGRINSAAIYFDDAEMRFKGAFHRAYKYCTDEKDKERLDKLAKDWYEARKKFAEEAKEKNLTEVDELRLKSKILGRAMNEFNRIVETSKDPPRLYAPVEDFAINHAAETISNVAFKAYDKYGKKAPVIALENVYPEMAFSRAESLRNLIENSKEKFIEKLMDKKGMKREKAEDIADKLIGATWDIGHINMLRKAGYSEKEIVKETKKIAPFVKKAHVTDNFGYSDSHLPPGMGNVPVKKIMEELEKAGFSGKAIMEAGGFVQHFKVSPHPYALEAMGSPIYSEGTAATWAGARNVYGAYFAGYGPFLPEEHFSMYGGGFSTLPMELGGQVPGRQSRLSGTPVD